MMPPSPSPRLEQRAAIDHLAVSEIDGYAGDHGKGRPSLGSKMPTADYDAGCRVKSTSTKCPTRKSRTSSSPPISRPENAWASRTPFQAILKELGKDVQGTHVSLHRSKMGRVDRMIKSGRFEDLYREFKAVAPSTQSEYFMMEAGRKVGPQEIEDLAKLLGIVGQR